MKLPATSLAIFAALVICSASLFARNASEVSPLLIGSELPDVSLTTQEGDEVSLSKAVGKTHTVIMFYRGGWCPYCNRHMQEVAEIEGQLKKLGYQIIAISPDSPDELNVSDEKLELGYELYSDSSMSVADAFGISFTLNEETLKKYKAYGIDLDKASGGANKDRLPVPAIFFISPGNKITFQYVDPNYRSRIPGSVLLAAAEANSAKAK